MKNFRIPLRTLRQRLLLILSVCMILCLVLVIFVSYLAIRTIEKTRLETSMESDLRQLTASVDGNYNSLLQISQQMSPQGNIGVTVQEYLQADVQYDRIQLRNEFTENINIATFSSNDVSLAAYYKPDPKNPPGEFWLANLSVSKNFDPQKLASLIQNNEIVCQAMHPSQNRFVKKEAVSLLRPIFFNGEESLLVYVEAYTSIAEHLKGLTETQNIPYYFLQLDKDKQVCYSSNEAIPVGTSMAAFPTQQIGVQHDGDYVWVAAESEWGFQNVLMVPQAAYNREMNRWIASIVFVVVIAVAIMGLTVLLLLWLIYRPLKLLDAEIEAVGNGNLEAAEHQFDIEEFDLLFGRFNYMKEQILQLMEHAREQEKERLQLELDKLYYQINPHFLMNALNSVHWMAVTNKQPEIDKFVYQLNYILGYSLGKTNRKATLRTEIKSLSLYLELQKARYDFEVWLDVEEGEYLDYPCARLILQPLAENAVCHNMDEFGNLWVTIRPESGDMVCITMRDDGHGFVVPVDSAGEAVAESRKNKGIGLQYVRRSLEAFYGDAASIHIDSTPNKGTIVTLKLPYRKQEGEEPCTGC